MSTHPNEPDAARLDGMTGTWSFLKGLLDEMPRHPRISVDAAAIASAAPKPEVEPRFGVGAPLAPVQAAVAVELVVDLTLADEVELPVPALVDALGPAPQAVPVHVVAPHERAAPIRRGAGPAVLPLREHRSRRTGTRPGRRLVA